MAMPPEPLAEVLPEATDVVMGRVQRVVSQDATPPEPVALLGMTGSATQAPKQVVVLVVEECLRGTLARGEQVTVTKPAGAYALAAGHRGPFLLKRNDAGAAILGRYGPDTYTRAALDKALAG